jgi:hypothetical protein
MLNVTSDAIFLRARATGVGHAFAGQPEPAQPRSSSYA